MASSRMRTRLTLLVLLSFSLAPLSILGSTQTSTEAVLVTPSNAAAHGFRTSVLGCGASSPQCSIWIAVPPSVTSATWTVTNAKKRIVVSLPVAILEFPADSSARETDPEWFRFMAQGFRGTYITLLKDDATTGVLEFYGGDPTSGADQFWEFRNLRQWYASRGRQDHK